MTAPAPLDPYDPGRMLDQVAARLGVATDAALCRALDLTPSLVCRVRRRSRAVCAGLVLRIHEATGIPIREVRAMAGDRRRLIRPPKRTGRR